VIPATWAPAGTLKFTDTISAPEVPAVQESMRQFRGQVSGGLAGTVGSFSSTVL